MSIRFLCRVTDEGHLVPLHPERLRRRRGGEVWVSLHEEPSIGIRSKDANARLWGVVYKAISEETGNDPADVHYAMKRRAVEEGILEPEFILIGDVLHEADPTTRTDSDTFHRYMGWVEHIALHELHIVIPSEEAA